MIQNFIIHQILNNLSFLKLKINLEKLKSNLDQIIVKELSKAKIIKTMMIKERFILLKKILKLISPLDSEILSNLNLIKKFKKIQI